MNTRNEELHRELLDVTREVIEICEKHNIRYYLAWGSCLGAVRHQNIIPWDDDVDLYVDYQDLDRLKAAFKENQKYFYQDLDTDPECFEYWPKVRKNHTTSMDLTKKAMNIHWGICVDIFPLVHYGKPATDRITNMKITSLAILSRFPYYKKLGNRSIHKLWKMLYACIGEKGRKKLFYKILNSINQPDGAYLLDISDYTPHLVMTKDSFGEGEKFPFGTIQAKVPSAYDKYMRLAYGDNYMEIPPEDSELRYFHSSSLIDCKKDYHAYLEDEDTK